MLKKVFFVIISLWLTINIFQVKASTLIPAIELQQISATPLGQNFQFFKEKKQSLTKIQALKVFHSTAHNQQYIPQSTHNSVLSFGIGSKPVWLYARINNTKNEFIKRNILIKNIWIDSIKITLYPQASVQENYNLGDSFRFDERLIDSRFFIVPYKFQPGKTELLIRVETKDAINLPIYLLSDTELQNYDEMEAYTYGFLYGATIALLFYNFIIFLSLRDKRYFYYSAFLAFFFIMNFSYTGHGFRWIWSENTTWQMWCGSVTIILFNLSGLQFARKFLLLEDKSPFLNNVILYLSYFVLCIFTLFVLMNNNLYALITAMSFTLIYPFIMVGLGIFAYLKKISAASYFLIGSISATLGTILTALSVWGLIPFNNVTFRAVEIGMLIDIVLLSLALAETVKESHVQKVVAETKALIDPLTQLFNRRGLYKKINVKWDSILKQNLSVSTIMLDIDHFKTLNDQYGHKFGDHVLNLVAKIVSDNAREEDIAVRWGGEEFLMILIDTKLANATAIAERIRRQIESQQFKLKTKSINVSASFGVATLTTEKTIDQLINSSDEKLYSAKNSGRNKVSS